MSNFIHENFLLRSEPAKVLYHHHAVNMPILDYHNHLSPKDIATNRKFKNLSELWLEGDHYKWRAMRANGVPEKFCTGNASPIDKFVKWAETVPSTLRNPLYHWTHLELKRYFNVDSLLNGSTAKEIYHHCNTLLHNDEYSVRSLLHRMHVEVVCTTDDPTDTLQYHKEFANSGDALKMYPTFRPDKAFAISDARAYSAYVEKLSAVSGVKSIKSYDDLLGALVNRMDWFQSLGCRASDHGLEFLHFEADAITSAKDIFKKVISGGDVTPAEEDTFRCALLNDLCKQYHQRGWAQQFHLGAMRNNNSRTLKDLGPDTGFDSVGDFSQAKGMARFFDSLDRIGKLSKTIIYNLNPADNAVFASMLGNFNDGVTPGKMQYGSGWWFLDQKDGMVNQINALSNMGLLSRFVGMVTDSRSFLSFPRHEYFRRILCNVLGDDIESGEIPHDIDLCGHMIEDVCYNNSRAYFGF
jgi:glucuronate isomerase